MSSDLKNTAASVRQRLANKAKSLGIEFQRALVLYGIERLLYRLSVSPHADRFILKGASLFSLWLDEPHRRTRDVDLLSKDQDVDADRLASLFMDLCSIGVEDDGLRFDPTTVKAAAIREGNAFGGMRVTLVVFLENARIALQVDIGLGDATIPEPLMTRIPTLLQGFEAPVLMAYQRETVVAEKLHALVILERSNSRMKDFFDLFVLAQEFGFTMPLLCGAVHDVFARRCTELPQGAPDGLTQAFADDSAKQAQWKAFLKQYVMAPRNTLTLAEVVSALHGFLMPVLTAASRSETDPAIWVPGGPWSEDQAE